MQDVSSLNTRRLCSSQVKLFKLEHMKNTVYFKWKAKVQTWQMLNRFQLKEKLLIIFLNQQLLLRLR